MRFGLLTANLALFAVIGLFVVSSSASQSGNVVTSSQLPGVTSSDDVNPLDQLSSADVAVHVARMTRMSEATAVTNKADTVNAQLAIAAADDSALAKPQIISTGLKSKKDIKKYVAVEGDTVASVAAKFGVTSDTIRLSNGITGDAIPIGKELTISPVNGIVYTVSGGDTPESIATKYRASKDQLIAFNDAELTGTFQAGDRIVIPDGLPPVSVRYSYAAAPSFAGSASYGSNGYDYGWCTWHAANRRMQTGNPIPSNLGNAVSWLGAARTYGLQTGSEPRAGAVLYHLNIGGLGHVAYVESVNDDGSILVSDMNYPSWGRVTTRTVSAGEMGSYRFIY